MSKDPTGTLYIRQRAIKEIDRRFTKVKRFIRQSFSVGKLMMIANVTVNPGQYQYLRDSAKIDEFNRQLQQMIDEEVLGITLGTIEPKDHWLNVHVGNAYERGAKKTRALAERGILNIVKLPDYNPLINLAHIERAELIFTRVFNDMKHVTDVMRQQMSRELSVGMLRGENPKKVAARMVDRVDKIGMTRARLIARTEIVESHNQASAKEAQLLEKETGVAIKMQWITAMDGRERESHAARHLNIYGIDEAQGMLGEPNCRCSISAYIDIAQIGKKS